jgi:ATP-dependent Clp protease adaptor protein ClpS/Clp amino terminal domain, pathogenicity island component/ClpX C4-type zinc finger
MRNADDRDSKSVLTCSLCGKSQDDLSDLAGGPAVFVREFICDECVSSELAKPESPALAFSQGLDESLRRAVALAGRRPHEAVMPEHLLLALTDDPDAAPVMQACNVDLEKLRNAVLASMSTRDGTPLPGGTEPRTSQSFQTDLQRAAVHAQSIGREEINGADVLVAMLAGPTAGFLHEQGMARYDATTFIGHGITKDAQATPRRTDQILDRSGPWALSGNSTRSSLLKVQLLNDDYTPMKFVVYVLQEVFELEHEDAVRIMLQTHHEGVGACGTFPVRRRRQGSRR